MVVVYQMISETGSARRISDKGEVLARRDPLQRRVSLRAILLGKNCRIITMADDTVEVEIHLLVDEDGNYHVDTGDGDVSERFNECHGDSNLAKTFYTLTLIVPKPKVVAVSATLPAQADGNYALEIKTA